MSKVQVLDVVEIDGVMYTVDKTDKKSLRKIYSVLAGTIAVSMPSVAMAAGDETFNRIWETVMNGLDWMAIFVTAFSGVAWMLGHRTKAIELIIGVSCGFLVARYAPEWVSFLKTI